jgi:hypothetical protein
MTSTIATAVGTGAVVVAAAVVVGVSSAAAAAAVAPQQAVVVECAVACCVLCAQCEVHGHVKRMYYASVDSTKSFC